MSNLNPMTPAQVTAAQTSQWKEILRQALADMRVAIPGIIESFDAAKQTAVVQIAIREKIRQLTGPEDVAIAPLQDVPIVLPRAGGFSLTLPLKAGDECLVVFADMCIDLWWARGGTQDQLERRRHDLSDCFCIPGPWSQPRVLANYSTSAAQLRSDDGQTVVEVQSNKISLTSPGDIDLTAAGSVNINGQHVVVASSASDSKVDGKTFLSHEHTGVTTGGGVTGPVA